MTIDEVINKIKQLDELNSEIWRNLIEVCNNEDYKKKMFSDEHFYRGQGYDMYLSNLNNVALFVKEHYAD